MNCAPCKEAIGKEIEMELCRMFGRDHHYVCKTCGHQVACDSRFSKADLEHRDSSSSATHAAH